MGVQRLLIADATGTYSKPIAKQLKNEFLVKTCDDGERAMELIRKFDPDILVIDLQLPNTDGLSVLRSMRAAGSDAKVIVICGFADDYICAELARLQVSNVYKKPCLLGAVISCIREIAKSDDALTQERCIENEIDRILLNLNFQMGRGRYQLVHAAVLYLYDNPYCSMTKCLYPTLARQFTGTIKQVEKAIRDAIKIAWINGSRQMWYLYFPPGVKEGHDSCPPNEVFLARIANVLIQKKRLKKPLDYETETAI